MPQHRQRAPAWVPSEGAPAGSDALGDDCPVRVLHPEALARARATLRPDLTYADLAETFRALGDASRAKILHALLSEELCVCDLAALLGITESAVSQHLRVLRSLRVVRSRKAGRVVFYSLEDACIRALLTIALTHLDDPAAGGPVDVASAAAPPRRRRGIGHPHRSVAPEPPGSVASPGQARPAAKVSALRVAP
jgi:DNA-binding transcriptional ArsR family regulator